MGNIKNLITRRSIGLDTGSQADLDSAWPMINSIYFYPYTNSIPDYTNQIHIFSLKIILYTHNI